MKYLEARKKGCTHATSGSILKIIFILHLLPLPFEFWYRYHFLIFFTSPAMASISLDIASAAFMTLTSTRSNHISTRLPSAFLPFRPFTFTLTSFQSPPLAPLHFSLASKRTSRRFSVASTATPTSESDESDVLTKIPPDDRIPATIITGFLGSGKVWTLSLSLSLSRSLSSTVACVSVCWTVLVLYELSE